jgi:hypothetical protein
MFISYQDRIKRCSSQSKQAYSIMLSHGQDLINPAVFTIQENLMPVKDIIRKQTLRHGDSMLPGTL